MIWPVVTYGSETWTIRAADRKRLEAFEMWIWRRMENISWTERITNEEVLNIVEEKRCFLYTIRCRQKNWIGHILRGDSMLRKAIEGKMKGKKPQ